MRAAGEKGAEMGVTLAGELLLQLRAFVQGVYLIPAFGRYDLAAEVLETAVEPVSPV